MTPERNAELRTLSYTDLGVKGRVVGECLDEIDSLRDQLALANENSEATNKLWADEIRAGQEKDEEIERLKAELRTRDPWANTLIARTLYAKTPVIDEAGSIRSAIADEK